MAMESGILWNFQLASAALINIGILSAIWSTTPLTISVAEYFLDGVVPGKVNLLGLFCLTVGSVCVSFAADADAAVFGTSKEVIDEKQATKPAWVPVVLSIGISIIMAIEQLLTRRSVSNLKIDPYDSTFSRFCVFGVIGFVMASVYYPLVEFDYVAFLYGFGGSSILCISKMFFSVALQKG